MSATSTRNRRKRPVTAADREQRDHERREQLEGLHGRLTEQVDALVNSDEWRAMLTAAARFHRYSFRNVCLIASQFPEATQVAGYRTWQSMGRQVRRGEHGIAVLAPVTYRTQPDELQEGTEPEPGVRQLRGFKIERVFDVSQTDGEAIPDVRPVALTGDSPAGLWDAVRAQIEADGFTVKRGVCANPGANGETSFTAHTVTVREDLEPAQATRTLIHERAHIALGHGDELRLGGCRGRIEVEAESVSFMVSSEAGMPAGSYSLPYVAGWADGDSKMIAATAERVITAARTITDALSADDEAGPPRGGHGNRE